MLKIQISGYTLDLPSGVSVDFSFNQGAFAEEVIKGDGSYDITFKETPNNNKAFKYAKHLYSPKGLKMYDCLIDFGADTLVKGSLMLWETNNDGYLTTIEKNDFPFLVDELSIRDLNWQAIDIGPTSQDAIDYAKDAQVETDDTYPVRFPQLYAPNWYKEENPDFIGVVNKWNAGLAEHNLNTITADVFENNHYSLLPVVTLFAVLKQIATDYGYSLKGNALESYEIKNIVFGNNHSLDQYGSSYAQLDAAVADTITSEGADSNYDVLSSVYSPSAKGTHLISIEGSKDVNITNAIFALCYDNAGTDTVLQVLGNASTVGSFEITYEYYLTDLATDIYIVAYKSNGLDPDPVISSTDIRIENIGNNNLNVFAQEINVANHLPDISIPEFLVLYKKAACLTLDFNKKDGSITVNKRESLLSLPVETLEEVDPKSIVQRFSEKSGYKFAWNKGTTFSFTSDKYEGELEYYANLPLANDVNQYAKITSETAWYKVEYDDTTKKFTWVWQASAFDDYELGESNFEEISISATPHPMARYGAGILPYIIGNAYSPILKSGEKSSGVELLIYHGMKSDGGNTYPYASSNSYRFAQAADLMGLQFEGAKGLFIERFKEWYEAMLFSDEVEMQVALKNPRIQSLFQQRLYYDGVMMLLSELELSVDNNRVKPSGMVLRKV